MNKYILPIAAAAIALAANAETETLKITLNNGTTTEIAVSDIKEMTFETVADTPADEISGVYAGKQQVTVGGQFTYDTDLTYTLTEESDGTLTVSTPQYSLENTMMGNLTLGAVTIKGLTYDESKGGYYRMYANDGIQQHFTAVNNGTTVFDGDYTLGGESNILVKYEAGKISVENPFKLGAMPLPLSASFEGTKE